MLKGTRVKQSSRTIKSQDEHGQLDWHENYADYWLSKWFLKPSCFQANGDEESGPAKAQQPIKEFLGHAHLSANLANYPLSSCNHIIDLFYMSWEGNRPAQLCFPIFLANRCQQKDNLRRHELAFEDRIMRASVGTWHSHIYDSAVKPYTPHFVANILGLDSTHQPKFPSSSVQKDYRSLCDLKKIEEKFTNLRQTSRIHDGGLCQSKTHRPSKVQGRWSDCY